MIRSESNHLHADRLTDQLGRLASIGADLSLCPDSYSPTGRRFGRLDRLPCVRLVARTLMPIALLVAGAGLRFNFATFEFACGAPHCRVR
jgi:hypothetical protein